MSTDVASIDLQQGGGSRPSAVTAADYIISTLLGGGGLALWRSWNGAATGPASWTTWRRRAISSSTWWRKCPPASVLVLMIRSFAMLAAGAA